MNINHIRNNTFFLSFLLFYCYCIFIQIFKIKDYHGVKLSFLNIGLDTFTFLLTIKIFMLSINTEVVKKKKKTLLSD